jgi:hypothetical protein
LAICKNLRVKADPVVAHTHAQIGLPERDLGLNVPGICVSERILNGLADDSIYLIPDSGNELARRPFDHNAVLRR